MSCCKYFEKDQSGTLTWPTQKNINFYPKIFYIYPKKKIFQAPRKTFLYFPENSPHTSPKKNKFSERKHFLIITGKNEELVTLAEETIFLNVHEKVTVLYFRCVLNMVYIRHRYTLFNKSFVL